jgi:NitT/TauT family transport system ATP-binding protein
MPRSRDTALRLAGFFMEAYLKDILEFKNVSMTYHSDKGETFALKGLTFTVKESEFVSVIGPSGCGKTTVLSLIAGLLRPTGGEILLDGKPVERAGRDVGYMLQKDQLFPWRKIYKNIRLGLEIKKNELKEELSVYYAYADKLLEKYGLSEFKNHYPGQLSGGMRQRAALIRTLAFNPKILLLDEPFSALDFQTRLNVCDDVYSIIAREDKTAVLVTHDISEAISLSGRVIVLSKRPGTIKSIYDIPLSECKTPLKRREHPKFSKLFEKIWRDICDE